MDIINAIRDYQNETDNFPLLFNLNEQSSRDFIEITSMFGHFAKFIVIDSTQTESIRQEITDLLTNFSSILVQPIIQDIEPEIDFYDYHKEYPWILSVYCYDNPEIL